jgi:hypothetical protein
MGLTQKLGTIPLAILTDSSNNVGIGAAANASFKLQVTGATNLTGALSGTSANFSGDLTIDTNTLFVDSTNNRVGIGTTSPATRFELAGSSGNFQIGSSGAEVFFTRNENNDFLANGGSSAGIRFGGQQQLRFATGSSLTTRLTIDSTGAATFTTANLGHSLTIQNTNSGYYSTSDYLDNAGSEKLIVGYANSGAGALASKAIIYGTTGVGLNFYTNGSTTAKMVIDTNGNVGIGTSTAPSERLHLVNSTNGFVGLRLEGTSTYAGSDWTIYASSSSPSSADDFLGFFNNSTTDGATADYKLRIFKNGNVGIGTSSPNSLLHLQSATASGTQYLMTSAGGGTALTYRQVANETTQQLNMVVESNHPMVLWTNSVERMRITSGGFLKAKGSDSTYFTTNNVHELRTGVGNDYTTIISSTAASPYGVYIAYPNANPNGSVNEFFICADNTATRVVIRSNGGLANYQANDVNLSDERTKKDIIPLESYWDKFKAIEIVKFKYKDQTHDDFNIGVIAQQVEKVAPEFVDIDGWDNGVQKEKEVISNEEPLKSIYTADLHHATIKVLQEAMAKIEDLEARIKQLENK